MATPRGTPRARSSGGRVLMILGVLLALAAGVLVIFIVNNATAGIGQTEQLVVATKAIKAGSVLSLADIQTDFAVKSYPQNLVPNGAYIYTSPDDLDVHLNNQVVTTDIAPGDVYLTNDSRFQPVGSVASGSLTASNPSALPPGSLLFVFSYPNPSNNTRSFVVAGDNVDVIATLCGAPYVTAGSTGDCATQVVLQNVVVYATFTSSIVVVLTPLLAKGLEYLLENGGKVTLALLKPGDKSSDTSQPVNASWVAHNFHFT